MAQQLISLQKQAPIQTSLSHCSVILVDIQNMLTAIAVVFAAAIVDLVTTIHADGVESHGNQDKDAPQAQLSTVLVKE